MVKKIVWGLTGGLLGGLALISGCALAPSGGATATTGFDWTWIVFLVVIFAAFYFLLIRPQSRRQKEHQKLIEDLKQGDEVITTGGIYGKIESVSDDSLVIKVESGATMRVAKQSIVVKRSQ